MNSEEIASSQKMTTKTIFNSSQPETSIETTSVTLDNGQLVDQKENNLNIEEEKPNKLFSVTKKTFSISIPRLKYNKLDPSYFTIASNLATKTKYKAKQLKNVKLVPRIGHHFDEVPNSLEQNIQTNQTQLKQEVDDALKVPPVINELTSSDKPAPNQSLEFFASNLSIMNEQKRINLHTNVHENTASNAINPIHFEIIWRDIKYYHLGMKIENSTSIKKENASLNAEKKQEKNVTRPALNRISGSIRSGQITAIMGPSGAGKTVFLNCLSGFLDLNARKENTGDIVINGVQSARIGFVEQFDQLLPHLTIEETLLYSSRILNAARYRLNHWKIINNVIERLDLAGHRRVYASNLSNGQRKRLSIAVELVFNSDILMLDEPTTGLDSVTGYEIIKILKSITKRRKTMATLATIHQPSTRILELFDELIIFSRGGTIIYQGPPGDLSQTLQSVGLICPLYTSISDFVLEVASGDFGQESLDSLRHLNIEFNEIRLNDNYNEFDMFSLREAVRQANRNDQRSMLLCWWILFCRNVICNYRNPFNTRIRIVSLLGIAFVIGILFTDSVGHVSTCPPTKFFLWRQTLHNVLDVAESQQFRAKENLSILFFLCLISLMNSMLNLCITFPEEVRVFRREYNNYSYTILTYLVSKITADLPFVLVTTCGFVLIIHRMTGQFLDEWQRLYLPLLICSLVSMIGQFIGMCFGVIFYDNIVSSIFSVVFILIPILLCSGFFKIIKDLNQVLMWFSNLSFLKPAMNALLIVNYGMGRCTSELYNEQQLVQQDWNKTGNFDRPAWIDSLATLIDFQINSSNDSSSSLDQTESKENKLLKFMGYNNGDLSGKDREERQALILQHFKLDATEQMFWSQVYMLLLYNAFFSLMVYICMMFRLKRKKN